MFELNLFCFIINLCVAVLAGALMPIIPILTRKSFLFGVKIPLEHHNCPEARSMKKSYISICLAGSAVILALITVQFIAVPDMTLLCTMYFPFLFAAVQMAAFIPNWKRAVKLKKEQGWQVSKSVFAETKSSHSRGTMSELPWIWYIAGIILIIISVIAGLIQYPGLPDQIPTHFDFNMEPDAWMDKSLWGIFMLPLINTGMLAMMWCVGFMFVKAKLQIDPQNPGLSFTQHIIYRRRIGHTIGFLALSMAVLFMLIGFMTIFPDFTVPFWLIMTFSFAPIAPMIAVLVKSGQGGCRIKPKAIIETAGGSRGDTSIFDNSYHRGDDRHWIIGLFYYNPDDPARVVEDRFGNNLGFNYARLSVKIGVTVLALALIASYVWITIMIGSL
jgi:uncharacterized membrane protein